MKPPFSPSAETATIRAYTLIEALVASSILLIGISAAASLSLTMVTQEEMNERSVTAANYLDNAARLYQLGVDHGQIRNLLPVAPVVESLTFNVRDVYTADTGSITAVRMNLSYKATTSTANNPVSSVLWTGGRQTDRRSESVEVIRSNSFLSDRLQRATYIFNNP
jgi:type II secretory pathway pseudopilin PulG